MGPARGPGVELSTVRSMAPEQRLRFCFYAVKRILPNKKPAEAGLLLFCVARYEFYVVPTPEPFSLILVRYPIC